ncbi:hypothetical protein [Lentzea xinjiangensis]|nr:hypothetical protein [Lentzea xinjiangensis]
MTATDPSASFPSDLVEREFDQSQLNAVWPTDITYLSRGEGEMFPVRDTGRALRRALGYSVAEHIGADMVTEVIEAAVAACSGNC